MVDKIINLDPSWIKSGKEITVLYTGVRCVRNFKGLVFPEKLAKSRYKAIEQTVEKAFKEELEAGDIRKIQLDSLTENEFQMLVEKRVVPKLYLSERGLIKLYATKTNDTFILTNYKNHLTVYSYASGNGINKAYKNVRDIISKFNEGDFAKSAKYNYLASDLSFLGSGFKAYTVLSLPYLRLDNKLFSVTNSFKQNGFEYTRYNGYGSDLEDLLTVVTIDSFADSEQNSLKRVTELVKALKETEAGIKDLFINNDDKKNKILEKIDTLANTDYISYKTFLELYFNMLVANDLGIYKAPRLYNRMLYKLKSAHLSKKVPLSENEENQKRSQEIKKIFRI